MLVAQQGKLQMKSIFNYRQYYWCKEAPSPPPIPVWFETEHKGKVFTEIVHTCQTNQTLALWKSNKMV